MPCICVSFTHGALSSKGPGQRHLSDSAIFSIHNLFPGLEYLILFPVVVSLSKMPESPLMRLHLLQWTPSLSLWSPIHVRFSLWPLQPRGCQGCVFTPDLSCQVSTVHHAPFSPMFPHCQERTTWKTLAKFNCQLETQPWPPLHHVPAQWPCANIFQKFPSRWC